MSGIFISMAAQLMKIYVEYNGAFILNPLHDEFYTSPFLDKKFDNLISDFVFDNNKKETVDPILGPCAISNVVFEMTEGEDCQLGEMSFLFQLQLTFSHQQCCWVG